MKSIFMKKIAAGLLCLVMILAVLAQASCGTTPAETTAPETTATPETTTPETTVENTTAVETTPEATTAETTPEATTGEATPEETTGEATPEETTGEATPEATPEETAPETDPIPDNEINISYDLDGGIDAGNPTVYVCDADLKIMMPIRPGYDFVGWTGTGIDTPTVELTIAAGSTEDMALKANWVENGEFEFKLDETTADILGKIFFGNSNAAFIINGEDTFESRNNLDGTKNEEDKVIKEKMPSINASTELLMREFRAYLSTGETLLPIIYDVALEDATAYDFLFYFGISDCAPAEEFVATLNYAQYGIAINENSLCFISWTEAATAANGAILYEIIEHVVKGGSFSDFIGARYVSTVEGTVGAGLPALPGLDGGTDVGEGAYQVYSLDSTKEIYDAYLKALEEAGYTLHTTNVMNKTHTATYYNETEVVNVMFAGGDPEGTLGVDADRSLRVVVDPMSITALPMTEKPADATSTVKVSSVTQLYPTNLCIIFQLSNGHYVILDSGNNGDQKAIFDFLVANAPEGETPVIEAWMFSHFHQDHIGGFIDLLHSSRYRNAITIKSIIYNFPSERTYMTASGSSKDMNNMQFWYNKHLGALRDAGTIIYQARTGQKYYFGNAEIEVLWTFEDLTPFNIYVDDTNRTDNGFRVTIEGQTFMLTGDSTEEQFRIATARYGDYLKSDFLQLAHHGSGNNKGSHDLYTIVNATVVFHPRKQTLAETNYKIGANEKKALQNAPIIIRSGNYHTATIKLPYTLGDPIVSDRTPEDESATYN